MPKGRRTKAETQKIKKFIAELQLNRSSEILNKDGEVNRTKVINLIKDELGIKVDIHGVLAWLKSTDLVNYKTLSAPEQNERTKELKERLEIAKDMSEDKELPVKERLTALNTYRAIFSEISDYEKQLKLERLAVQEVSRPNHLLNIGHYENIEKTCPKCGHKFYDIKDDKKEGLTHELKKIAKNADENKENWAFESGKGQSNFDDSKEGNDDKQRNV